MVQYGFLHHPAHLSAPSKSLLLLCSESDPVTISRPFQRQILIWQHLLSDSTHLELGIRSQESDERDRSSTAVIEDICPWLLAETLTFLCSKSPRSFLIQESKMQDTSPKTIFCHTVVHAWLELESVGVAVLRMEALCVTVRWACELRWLLMGSRFLTGHPCGCCSIWKPQACFYTEK